MPYLIMRLMAPLMSFGATLVDQNGPTLPFPGRSLLTGLIGNALGWRHGDTTQLQRLQNHLQHGVRADRRPGTITDYQTADLGQDFLVAKGWTTRGRREDRGKGAATTGTHIRYRDYLADGAFTVALTVPPEADVILETIAAALHRPARPLFI
ncbi:MAG: type I-E CRISPR-associated protein Cas5/CasD, partial [Planctomycetota bacterium]